MGSVSGGAAYNPSFLIRRYSPHDRRASLFGLPPPPPPPPPPPRVYHRGSRRRLSTPHLTIPSARLDSSSEEESEQQQLNLSVLRFTLGPSKLCLPHSLTSISLFLGNSGIPGFDESYLPRWIGYIVGSLILMNHLAGWDSVTTAQLRSEGLGLCLAASAVALPFLGKFLKVVLAGANPIDRSALPAGNRQIFIMPESLAETQKEDLAWVSYVLLRNTNTMAVLISVQDMLCVRGYWNVHEDAAKSEILNRFKGQIQQIGFSDLKETLEISREYMKELVPLDDRCID
ncbi:hypothetical protein ACLOJK_006156 [Asimina triloba]